MKIDLTNSSRYDIWSEIDLNKFRNNIRKMKRLTEGREILLAIKANAYGHGAEVICQEAEREGIRLFGLATTEEGIALRKAGIRSRLVILTPAVFEQIEEIIRFELSPNIIERRYAEIISQEAEKRGKTAICHIEVETGMGRTGIFWEDAVGEIVSIARLPNIKIEGIFTHFPIADSFKKEDIEFTRLQIKRFAFVLKKLEELGIKIPIVHISNTAGFMNYPLMGNCVRPGILAYGLYPSKQVKKKIAVEPILELKTRVVQVQQFPKDWSISYGRTYKTTSPTRVAIIRAGYADGLRRSLSNKGEVLLGGRRCKIIGRICMDTTMVLVPEDMKVNVGDEVVLIGKQGEEKISADDMAALVDTINYEILTGISERVPRVYLGVRNSNG